MNKSYLINPVKATCQKYGKNYDGIQAINDTCFGICGAFSGTNDVYNMDRKCTSQCEKLVEERRHVLYGVGSCDHQTPYRPVLWGQVPRYVPILIRRGKDKEEARMICKKLCEGNIPLLKAECKEKCDLDASAVEEYEEVPSSFISPYPSNDQTNSPKKGIFGFLLLILLLIFFSVYILVKK